MTFTVKYDIVIFFSITFQNRVEIINGNVLRLTFSPVSFLSILFQL